MKRQENARRTWHPHLLALTVLVASAVPALAEAQQDDGPAVAGRVVDAESNAPIRNAFVRVLPTERGVFTDELGSFRLPVREMAAYYVVAGQEGYSDSEVIVEAAEIDTPVEFRLERDPVAGIALPDQRILADADIEVPAGR
jgi:hypothetical protein